MNQNGAKITARQRKLIEALLSGQTVSQACQAAGVGRRTYYRWLRQAHFAEALRQGEAELLTASMRRLLSMQGAAVDALGETVSDRRLPAARLQAAKMILDNLLRLRSAVELETRLAELERKLEQVSSQSEPPHTD